MANVNDSVRGFVVRSANGLVDEAAAFQQALTGFIRSEHVNDELIGTAVHAVFDKFRGQGLPMDAVASYVIQHLGSDVVTASNYTEMSENIKNYVRAHATDIGKGGDFFIGRGKNGGVRRQIDIPADKTTNTVVAPKVQPAPVAAAPASTPATTPVAAPANESSTETASDNGSKAKARKAS